MASVDLRAKVTFAVRIVAPDEYGVTHGEWEDRFTVRARVWPRLGGETVLAARLTGTQPVTITVRNSPDTREITPGWKATNAETGTEYSIRSIVDPEEPTPRHGRYIDLLCEAGVAT